MESEGISLKEFLVKVNEWKNYILSKWVKLFLISLIGGILGFLYGTFQKPKYSAELTFALEEKSSGGGGLGAYAGIASQFGIDIGGGNGGAFSGDNILELMKSRLLIEKTLLTEVVIGSKKILLVDYFIEINKLRESWESKPYLLNLKFNDPTRKTFTILNDSILFVVSKSIKEQYLEVSKVDKKLNIVSVKCISEDQIFAKYFVQELVKNVSTFYIETKTKKSRTNIGILENRTDSVKRELDREMYGAALNQDRNVNLIRAEAKVPNVKKQMNIQMLSAMYGELVKNLEFSKLALMREEPLIQIIDNPILPLTKIRLGRIKGFLIFGVVFFMSTFIFFIAKKIYNDALEN